MTSSLEQQTTANPRGGTAQRGRSGKLRGVINGWRKSLRSSSVSNGTVFFVGRNLRSYQKVCGNNRFPKCMTEPAGSMIATGVFQREGMGFAFPTNGNGSIDCVGIVRGREEKREPRQKQGASLQATSQATFHSYSSVNAKPLWVNSVEVSWVWSVGFVDPLLVFADPMR